ncbi:MAG: hypothetical protein ACLFUX_10420 [Spirochaetaceae bacterium]
MVERLARGGIALAIAGAIACHSGASTAPEADADVRVTYQRDIRPLMETHCTSCHHEGGIGPFPLTTFEQVRLHGQRVVDAVIERIMPPAQTRPECRPVIEQRWLSDADRALFREWADEGFPEGSPDSYEAPPPPAPADGTEDLGPHDITARMPEPYPFMEDFQGDAYDVVALDHTFEETTYVTATEVVPGDTRLLHHAGILVADSTGSFPELSEEEQEQASQGFLELPSIGGYFPGSAFFRLPSDAAFVVPAGSQLFLEVHYHLSNWPYPDPPQEDDTYVRLWTLEAGQVPAMRAETMALMNTDLHIEAGDANAVETAVGTLGTEPFTITAVTPHMHLFGKRAQMNVIREDGTRECVISTPNFDFDWQATHRFATPHQVRVAAEDLGEVTCIYDNSQENQPVVGGTQLRPEDVYYGVSSLDEMCVMYMVVTRPF